MWQKIHRGTSMVSHFYTHPSKLSSYHSHTKFGLMRISFEHSYFGALKIIDVMLILKRQAHTILKAPVAYLHETRQATYLKRNIIEARSRSHCCRGISSKYNVLQVCACIPALVIWHANNRIFSQ
jgi:hypothetical protein